ncbi:TPA: hypothetical protein IAA82_08095 [Candidatus Galligastranaerophilus gallistercoris]|nr:hypothetical protein [Candidatus Galligastranaerophilus gallistercoris]
MSMNENLESRVEKLTDVIKDLSDKPFISASDMNNILNSLIQKVEDTTEENIDKLTNSMSESLIDVLNRKHDDIKKRLDIFEEFVASVEKNVQNPKLEGEITRILNDIEALHSKMNSQEIQTDGLLKSFDSFKNLSSSGQISKLSDEIVSISKSYDGIVEVLNNNFEEFLRKVESSASRDELQRIRYYIESIEGNQNVLVSAMNAVNDKQEEIKNLIKQSSSAQNTDRFEQIQTMFNQLNKLVIDTASKADLEIIVDRINALGDFLNEFRRKFEDSENSDIRNVFQGQLNNIISKLEGLKLGSDSGVNEDIIRLYTSIAEFKDGVYSAINTQLNDVIASMDVQFDKISNSMVNAAIDTNETISNMQGELQKINSIVTDGLNSKTNEIKADFEKLGHNNAITIVNSIKGELSNLMSELTSLNNSDGIMQLAHNIENLRNGFDIDSLIMQVDQIKQSLDFEPIKQQLAMLNKDEAINLINGKLDMVLSKAKSDEILSKLDTISESSNLDNLYSALDILNGKLDFSSVEEKIDVLKETLNSQNLSSDITAIKDKLNFIDNIEEDLVTVKNLDYLLSDIKNRIEENFRLNSDKINEDETLKNDIKEALKAIYDLAGESLKNDEIKHLINEINLKLNEVIERINLPVNDSNLEASISDIKEGINSLNLSNGEIISNVKSDFNNLSDSISGAINSSNLSVLNALEELRTNIENINGIVYENIHSSNKETINIADEIKSEINNLPALINDTVKSSNLSITDSLNETRENIENVLTSLQDTMNGLDLNTIQSINEIKSEMENSLNSINEHLHSVTNKLYETPENEINVDALLNNVNENIRHIETSISDSTAALNSAFERLSNILNENINSASDKFKDAMEAQSLNIENAIGVINNGINFLEGKIENNKDDISTEEIKDGINILKESINSLEIKFEAIDNEKLNEIKEQIELVGEITKTISSGRLEESIEILKQDILSNNLENIKSVKEGINESYNNIASNISSLKISMQDSSKQEAVQQSFISVFDEFEIRLTEKISALEALIEEVSQSNDEKLQAHLIENLDNIKKEVKNSITEVIEQTNNSQYALLSGIIKTSLNEAQIEIGNLLKQEMEEFSNSLDEKSEVSKKELITRFAQIISARDNSEARINLIKTLTENISEILDNTGYIKSNIENKEIISDIKEDIRTLSDNLSNDFEETKQKIQNGFMDFSNLQKENNGDVIQAVSGLEQKILEKLSLEQETIRAFLDSIESKMIAASNNVDPAVIDIVNNAVKTNLEESKNALASIILNDTVKEEKLEEIKNSIIDSLTSSQNEKATELQGKIDDIVNLHIGENISSVKETIEQNSNEKLNAIINNIETNSNAILLKLNEYYQAAKNSDTAKDEFDSLKADIQNKLDNLAEFLMSKVEAETENKTEKLTGSINSKIDEMSEETRLSVESFENKIDEAVYIIQSKINELSEASSNNTAFGQDISNEITDCIKNEIDNLKDLISSAFETDKNKLDDINETVQNKINDISNEVASLISSKDDAAYKLNELNETLDSKVNEITNAVSSILSDANMTKARMDEIKDSVQIKTDEFSNTLSSALDNTNGRLDELNKSFKNHIDGILNTSADGNNEIKSKIEEIKTELNTGANRILEQLREEIAEVKSSIDNQIAKTEQDSDSLVSFGTMLEQKIQNKISSIEVLMDDSISKIDSKTSEIINTSGNEYKKSMDEKIDSAIEQLKSDFESKMLDVQKMIDDKVYDIMTRNNEILKDELKLRADSTIKDITKDFRDKIQKIESVLVKTDDDDENEETYTLSDIESDIAKIRLSLEKYNKLSNFKEFASRLVELKNINLENAKISRVIGADIMRFDSWLKNTTAKIDVLAAKIEKSEKIKMEDLKTRLIQSEKNQAMPQKLEEAIMSIYKKYRTQETKIEDLINKIETLSQKQTDTFDVKEFIDLFYDTTKKQENIMSRMDNIEDKMDLIQAKIDHIISSCIDE